MMETTISGRDSNVAKLCRSCITDHRSGQQERIDLLIAETVRAFPDRIAVRCDEEFLSYGDLLEQANGVAAELVRYGVGPGDLVGIYMERSVDLPVALLGVIRSGAAYVPMDPIYPEQRIRWMVEDASMQLILTDAALEAEVRDLGVAPVLIETIDPLPEFKMPDSHDPEHPAYVIFTSGSTGRPKGVQIPHRALTNFLLSMQQAPGMRADDVLLAVTTLSFDISVLELFLPLLVGGQLIIASRDAAMDGRALLELIEQHAVSLMQATPVSWKLMLAAGWNRSPNLTVLCGGEALPRDLADQLLEKSGEVWNMYGPTETTVWSTCDRVSEETGPVSIGRPIENTTVYIVDESLTPVADGDEGELVIGGAGLATGYPGRPDLTRVKFARLSTSGESIYRTGDIGKILPDGRLQCLGRMDHQVKLRGYRIEQGEIESLIRGHASVQDAVVTVYGDAEKERLAAYIVADCENEHTLFDELRRDLKAHLPTYMIPSSLMVLTELPLTPNGKVDRKALPEPDQEQPAVQPEIYETETERVLAGLWSNLLGISSVPRDVEFFEIGGNSLLGTQLFMEIRDCFDLDISMAALVRYSTVEQLAGYIDRFEELADERLAQCESLKLINRGNPGAIPLILIHAGEGRTLPFKELVAHMDPDQPIYAFRWGGQDGRPIDLDLSVQARCYAEELLRFSPGGTFRIGGYCHGGLVAIEMVKLLKDGGATVLDPLIVFGAPHVYASSYHRREPMLFGHLSRKFKTTCAALSRAKIIKHNEILPYRSPFGPTLAHHVVKSTALYCVLRRMKYLYRWSRLTKAAASGHEVPPESRDWYCGTSSHLGIMNHRSSRYEGDILFFQSGACFGQELLLTGWWDSLYLGFEELCDGRFEGYVLGGKQSELLMNPEIAQILTDKFNEASA